MNFLCSRCRDSMCPECIELTDEYTELLQNKNRALSILEDEKASLHRELAVMTNSAANWERTAKLGYPDIIKAWMDREMTAARPQVVEKQP